jgi:hypothetical protein
MRKTDFPPLPETKKRMTVQGDVAADVAVKAFYLGKKINMKKRDVIEWGLQAFVARFDHFNQLSDARPQTKRGKL